MIEIDVPRRRLHLDVSEAELARRRKAWTPPALHAERGWVQLCCATVEQADIGADLVFLRGGGGAPVPRESH
jgi:dihydroxy-acid dehydratase